MRRWPELRAGLVAVAIGFGLVDGCPLPPPDATPAWERGLVETVRRAQGVVETPVAWVRRYVRVGQQWALYQAPGLVRYRIVIDGKTADGTWRVLYRAGDDGHDWGADWIEYTRVRGAWDPTHVLPDQYKLFASWITARALREHADLVQARVVEEQVRLGEDGPVATGERMGLFERVRATRTGTGTGTGTGSGGRP